MTDRALLQQALVVFEGAYRDVLMNDAIPTQKLLAIMDALRARLAQPAIDGFGGNLDSAFDAPAPAVRERVKVLEQAIQHYEAALKARWPEGAMGESFGHWNSARAALEITPPPSPSPRS